jgi:hypothetical protein
VIADSGSSFNNGLTAEISSDELAPDGQPVSRTASFEVWTGLLANWLAERLPTLPASKTVPDKPVWHHFP